jgi:hypothetical protein
MRQSVSTRILVSVPPAKEFPAQWRDHIDVVNNINKDTD